MLIPHPISVKPPFESPHGWYYFQGFPKTFIEGSCMVEPTVTIKDEAKVIGHVILKDSCVIYGKATIEGNVVIGENAQVGGEAIVRDQCEIYGTTHIKGKAIVKGRNIQLYDNLIEA